MNGVNQKNATKGNKTSAGLSSTARVATKKKGQRRMGENY